ncbi:MAG: O-antigen ligase family protein [Acidobacteria bacterium]|nr:O-antigen ligase family protein [Acidobacteriota bacterium]
MLHTHPNPFMPPRVIPVNVYEEARRAPLWEQAFYTVWLFAVFMPIDAFQPIRYACIAGLLGILVVHYREVMPLMLKAWPLFPLPILAYFSIFWTPYPADALKSATLLFLTPTLLIVLAARLRAVEFLRLIMFAGWLGTLYTVPFFATLAEGGPYAQKNSLAFHMMLVILTSLGTFLNDEEPFPLRVIAIAFVPVAFLFQFLADSATSLVFAVGGSAVLIGVKLVWTGVSTVRHMRTTFLAFIAAVALVITLVVLSIPNNSIVDDFLSLVGKDSTFTGRTAIWNAAERVSAEHPWFGVGVEGFWNPMTGIAQTLNENDSKPFGTKLSFHSAFWETRVHFGWVGFGLFLLAIGWAGLRTANLWLRNGNLVNSTLLVMFVVIFISCFTESYASGTSNMMVYFLYFGGLAAFGIGERKFAGVARLVERTD